MSNLLKRICFLDSFCLWINTTNLQRDLLKLDLKYSLMDFSNYPKQHPMYNEKNKNRLWYLKDETKGIGVIISFVGLGPKQYSYITLSPDNSTTQKKVQKGLKRSSIKNYLNFDDYKEALFQHKNLSKPSFSIQSKNQQLYTMYERKKVINPFDDKRWLLRCNIHTKAYGNEYIKKYFDKCIKCEK